MISKYFYLFLPVFFMIELKAQEYKLLGYLDDINTDLKYRNSKKALKYWADSFTEGANLDTKVISFSNYNKYLQSYLSSDIDLLVINPYNYLINQKKLDENTVGYWYFQKDKKSKFQSMYLIVNKKSNINNISDLEGKKIVLKRNNYLGRLFLENLYLEKTKRSSKEFISNVDYIDTSTELLKTYFGTYDACVIDSYNYEIMYELNPSIKKEVKILDRSPKIFSNLLILFNKRNTQEEFEDYQKRLDKVLADDRKDDLFELFKINDITTFSPNENKKLNDFYNQFKILDQKYNR